MDENCKQCLDGCKDEGIEPPCKTGDCDYEWLIDATCDDY